MPLSTIEGTAKIFIDFVPKNSIIRKISKSDKDNSKISGKSNV